ncbi:vacuolar sorting protein 39 domain 2-domain-containing protein [Zopfochytrium polystomum]|nr:vacuolar sorting protein 39 domain 2-domain-containing protein [Zopfochytrium polystomum]
MSSPFTIVELARGIMEDVAAAAASQASSSAVGPASGQQPASSSSSTSTPQQRLSSVFAKTASFGVGSAASTPANTPPGTPSLGRIGLEAMELCENNLYIGTTDGHILHYEIAWEKETSKMSNKLVLRKNLGVGRKSVDALFAVPTEGKLFASCDGTLIGLQLDTLSPPPASAYPPLRSLSAVAPDSNLTSPYQVSVAKLRTIQTYSVSHDELTMTKEHRLPDGAVHMVKRGRTVCAADTQAYKLVNVESGEVVPLFPYDKAFVGKPMMCAVGKGEFLVVIGTPERVGLGMFVTERGDATRGTLQWPVVPKAIAFHFPYIIALLRNNNIEIHNLFTQELIQSIQIPTVLDPRYLSTSSFTLDLHDAEDSCIKVVIACKDAAIGLRMASFDSQINELLESRNVDQAVKLAEHLMQGRQDQSPQDKAKELQSIYTKAGFVYLRDTLFEDALGLFEKGNLDPAVLISMFPEFAVLLPGDVIVSLQQDHGSKQNAQAGSIAEIVEAHLDRSYPDVDPDTRTSFSLALVENAKEILVKYLVSSRPTTLAEGREEAIDTILLTIYADNNTKELYRLLNDTSQRCHFENSLATLSEKKRHYGRSLLYKAAKDYRSMLEIWMEFIDGILKDNDFGGLSELCGFLSGLEDTDLLFEYAEKVLKKDPAAGVKIFANKSRYNRVDDDDVVLSFLQRFGTVPARAFLEFLQKEGEGPLSPEKDRLLASLYIREMTDEGSADGMADIDDDYLAVDAANRPSFFEFLSSRKDGLSATRLAHSRLLESNAGTTAFDAMADAVFQHPDRLFPEKALVYTARKDHASALRTLVYNVHDYAEARAHCARLEAQEGNAPTGAESPLLFLIRLYVDGDGRWSHEYSVQVAQLLKENASRLDLLEIIKLIPDSWPLDLLHDYLFSSLRRSLHDLHHSQFVKSLSQLENLKTSAAVVATHRAIRPLEIRGTDACVLCMRPVADPTLFVRLPGPQGQAVHFHCLKRAGDIG